MGIEAVYGRPPFPRPLPGQHETPIDGVEIPVVVPRTVDTSRARDVVGFGLAVLLSVLTVVACLVAAIAVTR